MGCMNEAVDSYIVAIKRSMRDCAPADWVSQIAALDGVDVGGAPANPRRVQIKATEEGIARLRKTLGEICHVEPLVIHRPAKDAPR